MSLHRDGVLVIAALCMALAQRNIPDPAALIHHTDRGSQYTADNYLALLKEHHIQLSMSNKGDPDNAAIESFFNTLRAELTDLERFPIWQVARTAVFEFIEIFIIASGCIRYWATAALHSMKPLFYLECVSYSSSTKTGQDLN